MITWIELPAEGSAERRAVNRGERGFASARRGNASAEVLVAGDRALV